MSTSTKSVPNVTKLPKSLSETINVQTDKVSIVTKLLPFICAGTAVGVSILALKEIKKIRNEVVILKNQQINPNILKSDPELNKKMDQFEIQLKKINEYLMNNDPKNPKIIKNILKQDIPKDVKIINEPREDSEIEYEEVEVTDDEDDN